MRIGIIADDLYPGYGGQAVGMEGNILALLKRGHQIKVVAGKEKTPTIPPKEVQLERLPVWRPGDKQTHFALPLYGPVNRLLRWADIVHINTPTPLTLFSCFLAKWHKVPTVIGFHAQLESTSLHFKRWRPLVEWGLKRWYSTLYRQANCLVAPSPFAARLAQGFTNKPVYAVSTGISLPNITNSLQQDALKLRAELLGDKEKLLIYVGRLSPEKRPLDTLALIKDMTKSTLVIAGAGPMEQILVKEVTNQGLGEKVKLLGYVTEQTKQNLLTAADMYIMPSPTELLSLSTLEAMAYGCAIVAANFSTSAVPEMVTLAKAGFNYDPTNLSLAAASIQKLLADGATLVQWQENARAYVKLHDVNLSAQHLEEIYQQLLSSNTMRRF